VLIASTGDKAPTKGLFSYSILYLFAIFTALLIDSLATRVLAAG
jgi:heme O synthase-like polyprenyltransferase